MLSLDPPSETPVEPAPCPPGSTGEAGTLQFSAESYSVGESNPTRWSGPRTGGTTGRSRPPSRPATAPPSSGTELLAGPRSVRFADGDDTPRPSRSRP